MAQHREIERLRNLLALGSSPSPEVESQGGDANIWNLLVQILLPLVLVLIFVLLVVFEALSVDIEKWINATARRYESDKILTENLITKINQQWLILQRNLALRNIEVRKYVRLSYYPLDNPVRAIHWERSAGPAARPGIRDPLFAEFCQATYDAFADEDNARALKIALFESVVASSDINPVDASGILWDALGGSLTEQELDNAFASDKLPPEFDEKVLYPINKKRLAVEVNRSVHEMREDTITVQAHVLEAFIDRELQYRQLTTDLTEEERGFYARIMDPDTPSDIRQRTIAAWWQLLYDRLRDKYFGHDSNTEYPFLPEPS